MATTRTWDGKAKRISQVTTILIGSNTQNQTFIINFSHPSGVGDVVEMGTYTVGASDTTGEIADAIYYMLTTGSASGASGESGTGTLTHNHDFVTAVSYSIDIAASTVTCTAVSRGVPFILTVTGTGTSTVTTTTANSGPNCWDVASNWLEGKVPIDDDDVLIPARTSDILYGLNQTGILLDTLVVDGFSGRIGWSFAPLYIGASDEIHVDGQGSYVYWRIDNNTTTAIMRVHNCAETGISFNSAAGTITDFYQYGGRVIHGLDRGTAVAITDAYILGGEFNSYRQSTIVELRQSGGNVHLSGGTNGSGGAVPVSISAGHLDYDITGTVSLIVQTGGYVRLLEGTVTAYTLAGGSLDCTASLESKAIGTLTQANAGTVRFDTTTTAITTWTRTGPFETYGLGGSQ